VRGCVSVVVVEEEEEEVRDGGAGCAARVSVLE
jgi:hypothetical protein